MEFSNFILTPATSVLLQITFRSNYLWPNLNNFVLYEQNKSIFTTINVTPKQFVFNLDPDNVNFVEERSTVDQEK